MSTFGEKLFNIRRCKGYSQQELADMIGVSRQSVHKWEADKIFPTKANILSLCALFDVEENYFYSNENIDSNISLNVFEEQKTFSVSDDISSEISISKSTTKKNKILIIIFITLNLIFVGLVIETVRLGFLAFSPNKGISETNSLGIEPKMIFCILIGLTLTVLIVDLIAIVKIFVNYLHLKYSRD